MARFPPGDGENIMAMVYFTPCRAQVARRLCSEQPVKVQRSVSSGPSGPSRFEMLYSDASRRDENRRHMQDSLEARNITIQK